MNNEKEKQDNFEVDIINMSFYFKNRLLSIKIKFI